MENKIKEILYQIRPDIDFNSDKSFISAGYLDSYDVVTLVDLLEDTFDIVIEGVDIVPENFESIN